MAKVREKKSSLRGRLEIIFTLFPHLIPSQQQTFVSWLASTPLFSSDSSFVPPFSPYQPDSISIFKMEGVERQQSAEPSAMITSSADRMVGMDHAEVRYFTRYETNFFSLICMILCV
jgi:hypothetical protein